MPSDDRETAPSQSNEDSNLGKLILLLRATLADCVTATRQEPALPPSNTSTAVPASVVDAVTEGSNGTDETSSNTSARPPAVPDAQASLSTNRPAIEPSPTSTSDSAASADAALASGPSSDEQMVVDDSESVTKVSHLTASPCCC